MRIRQTIGPDMRVSAALIILAFVLGLLGAANLTLPSHALNARSNVPLSISQTGAIAQIRAQTAAQ